MPQGKDKPTYAPHKDEGDVVIVKNAQHVSFTGKKWDRKLYRWHTGYASLATASDHCAYICRVSGRAKCRRDHLVKPDLVS